MTTPFAEKIVAAKFDAVIYVTSEEHGVSTYFYMAVKGTDMAAFRQQLAEGGEKLTHYGTILESGYGEPPYALKQEMLQRYGCQPEHALKITPNN